jgi:thiol:disulfide interchange protein
MEYSLELGFWWRSPLLFQCVFAVYILVVTVWLMRRHGNERGVAVLAALRGVDRRVRW